MLAEHLSSSSKGKGICQQNNQATRQENKKCPCNPVSKQPLQAEREEQPPWKELVQSLCWNTIKIKQGATMSQASCLLCIDQLVKVEEGEVCVLSVSVTSEERLGEILARAWHLRTKSVYKAWAAGTIIYKACSCLVMVLESTDSAFIWMCVIKHPQVLVEDATDFVPNLGISF